MKRLAILPLLALFCACASGTISNSGKELEMITGEDSDSTSDFDVAIEQTTTPMAMPSALPGPVDVKYQITVENRTKEPVKLSQIDLQSIGGEIVQIDLTTRRFNKTIEPGAKASVDYWATARVRDANIGADSPLVIRTRLHFKSGETERKVEFTRRVNGRLAIGVGG
jgi:hypothetical protein